MINETAPGRETGRSQATRRRFDAARDRHLTRARRRGDGATSSGVSRDGVDYRQVERLKRQAYEEAVDALVKRFGS
jgi:hypothetical protein